MLPGEAEVRSRSGNAPLLARPVAVHGRHPVALLTRVGTLAELLDKQAAHRGLFRVLV